MKSGAKLADVQERDYAEHSKRFEALNASILNRLTELFIKTLESLA